MEYEIGDDPQGLAENCEAACDWGLPEDQRLFGWRNKEPRDEESTLRQLGEVA